MSMNLGFKIQGQFENQCHIEKSKRAVTYIVVGMNRGGTSAIAASLDALNIPLGADFYSPIFEDQAIAKAFRAKKWREVKAIADSYTAELGTYAWKLPDSIWQLDKVHKLFFNPRYLFVYRDVFAIANRVNDVHARELEDAIKNALRGYENICKFIRRYQPDCLHISYEKLLNNSVAYAETLMQFTQTEPTEEACRSITGSITASKQEYLHWLARSKQEKTLREAGFIGFLDGVTKNVVGGWLKHNELTSCSHVDIYVNAEKFATVPANQLRQDLIKRKIDLAGTIGFRFEFIKPLKAEDHVSVCISGTGIELIGSPKMPT